MKIQRRLAFLVCPEHTEDLPYKNCMVDFCVVTQHVILKIFHHFIPVMLEQEKWFGDMIAHIIRIIRIFPSARFPVTNWIINTPLVFCFIQSSKFSRNRSAVSCP